MKMCTYNLLYIYIVFRKIVLHCFCVYRLCHSHPKIFLYETFHFQGHYIFEFTTTFVVRVHLKYVYAVHPCKPNTL